MSWAICFHVWCDEMNKLTALIEAAKETAEKEPLVVDEDISIHGSTSWCRTQRKYLTLANPATILELCALLEKAEEALETIKSCSATEGEYGRALQRTISEPLAAIKQWKE